MVAVCVSDSDGVGVWLRVPVADGDPLAVGVWLAVLDPLADPVSVAVEVPLRVSLSEGDPDCEGDCVLVRVRLGVADGLCDCVGVGEHTVFRPVRRMPPKAPPGSMPSVDPELL